MIMRFIQHLLENSVLNKGQSLNDSVDNALEQLGATSIRSDEMYQIPNDILRSYDPETIAQGIIDMRRQNLKPQIDAARQNNIEAGLLTPDGKVSSTEYRNEFNQRK